MVKEVWKIPPQKKNPYRSITIEKEVAEHNRRIGITLTRRELMMRYERLFGPLFLSAPATVCKHKCSTIKPATLSGGIGL